MIAFAALAPWIDILAKMAAGSIPPVQMSLARFALQAALLFPVVALTAGLRLPAPRILRLHLARGVLMALASVAFIAAVQAMPLADAMAIFFVTPLILTALGGLLLGEEVGWRRLSACLVGFLGAILVVRPSFADLGWVATLPLATALCFVAYILLTRRLSGSEGAVAMQAWSGLFGTLTAAALLVVGASLGWASFAPVWPDAGGWALMAGTGIVATVSHLFLVAAFARAPTPILAPLQYLEIVSATLFGYWLFGDFPEPLTWAGIAIIVGSGLFVLWREARVRG
ncbi:DMT family transporter [Halovulum dunhuangense]|uniref:DMT family transporter n=1 Tax=Halovulum dunhuangense TaxID=1505036 RepID=A0A849L664_9RHOB|nr:DMT family transporter [Halovulum dunhuangense]NNU81601.1 DMT family transporter [Halovulum dunhuangense]